MADAWGGAWGTSSAWGVSWGSGAAPIVVIDTHDGERKRRRDEEFKQARERLREQIRIAIDGPDAPVLEPQLEAIAVRSKAPIEYRVDFEALQADIALLGAVRQAAKVRFEEEQKRRDLQMRWDREDNEDFEALML